MERYFECWKCGSYTTTDGIIPDYMCCASMAARISGICGGNFTKELTKNEVKEKEKKWRTEAQQDKKVKS